MLKKLLGFVLKTIWIIIVLLIPTIPVFVYLHFHDADLLYVGIAFLYFVPIIFIILLAWKSPRSLFVLSLGFLITQASYPFGSWLLGGRYWRDLIGGFGMGSSTAILGFLYSFPFAFIAFITAIIIFSLRKKPIIQGKSITGFEQWEGTVSPDVLQPDKTNKTADMAERETPNETNQ